MTKDQALSRWPRIAAHMICESLGYFTPEAAANAIAFYKAGRSYACEWYSHLCNQSGKGYFDESELIRINRDVLVFAIRNRARHTGHMRDYKRALMLATVERQSPGKTHGMLASWF